MKQSPNPIKETVIRLKVIHPVPDAHATVPLSDSFLEADMDVANVYGIFRDSVDSDVSFNVQSLVSSFCIL